MSVKNLLNKVSEHGYAGLSDAEFDTLKQFTTAHPQYKDLFNKVSEKGFGSLSDNEFGTLKSMPSPSPVAPAPQEDWSKRVKITNKGPLEVAQDLWADARGGIGLVTTAPMAALSATFDKYKDSNKFDAAGHRMSEEKYPGQNWFQRFGHEYMDQTQGTRRGEGVAGMVADPTNLLLPVVGKLASPLVEKAATSSLGRYLLAKGAQLEGKAGTARDIAASITKGGSKGAAYGATSTGMDKYSTVSMPEGVLFGGLTGGLLRAGSDILRPAPTDVPGVQHALSGANKKIDPADMRALQPYLLDFLRRGNKVIPPTRAGMLEQSGIERGKLSDRYQHAMEQLSEAEPNAIIDLDKVKEKAVQNLFEELGDWGTQGLTLAGTASGYDLPPAAYENLAERLNAAKASKLKALQDAHGGRSVTDLVSGSLPITTTDNMKVRYTLGSALNSDAGEVGRWTLRPSRETLLDVLRSTFPATEGQPTSSLVRTLEHPEAAQSWDDAILTQGLVRHGLESPVTKKILKRAEDAGVQFPTQAEASDALNTQAARWVTPNEASRIRTQFGNSQTYLNPEQGTPNALKKAVGQAGHEALNDELMQYPAYRHILESENLPAKFKAEKTWQRLLQNPGPIPLSGRNSLKVGPVSIGNITDPFQKAARKVRLSDLLGTIAPYAAVPAVQMDKTYIRGKVKQKD